MYKIKPLEQDNIIFIYKLMSEPNNVSALQTDIISLEEWKHVFAETENDEDEENFIIYENDTPCGWLKLNGLQNKDTAWISMLVVSDEFKHQGIGKFAVELAIQHLKHRGYKQIKLHTTEDNLPAIKLYTECGFSSIRKNSEKITLCKEV